MYPRSSVRNMFSDEAQEPTPGYIPFTDSDEPEPEPSRLMTLPSSTRRIYDLSSEPLHFDLTQFSGNSRSQIPSPPLVSLPFSFEQLPSTFQQNSANLLRASIWKVPPAKIIKDVMKCLGCNGTAVPPVYQCDNGHLICTNCVKKMKRNKEESMANIPPQQSSSGSWYLNPHRNMLHCPVIHIESETNNETLCGEEIYQVTLDIYSKLYEASILNCPVEQFGCFEKIPAAELNEHLQDCYYNKGKICPFTNCKTFVRLHNFVDHLIINHGLDPLKDNNSYNIKVYQDRLKYFIPMPPNNYFDWIGALICYAGCNYMLVLRESEEFILIWLHQIRPEPRSSGADDDDINALEEGSEGQLGEASVGNLSYTFKLIGQSGMEETWAGTVRPYYESFGQVFESGNYYRIFIPKLKTRYMQPDESDPRLFYWNMLIEFNEIESVVD